MRWTSIVLLVWMSGCQSEPISQPLPFNHQIHAKNEVGCDVCHEHVSDRASAGLPRVATCMACHESNITENLMAQPWIDLVRKNAAAGTEIAWVRLFQLPHHVYFSHRRHTAIAKLECPTCHGDMGQRFTPPPEAVQTLDMEGCMDCHEKNGVHHDCAWCHR